MLKEPVTMAEAIVDREEVSVVAHGGITERDTALGAHRNDVGRKPAAGDDLAA